MKKLRKKAELLLGKDSATPHYNKTQHQNSQQKTLFQLLFDSF